MTIVWVLVYCVVLVRGFDFFLFKQKTAYEMGISDWISDVCSSDLHARLQSARLRRALLPAGWLRVRWRRNRPAPESQPRPRWRPARWPGRRIRCRHRSRTARPQATYRRKPAAPPRPEPREPERSEERRGGKAWVSPCRSRGSP